MTFQVPPYALHYDDEAEIREAYWHPDGHDLVIDVGARYGSWTLPALAAGAMVVAVDPHRQILGLLRSAAELNGFGDNLETVAAALLDDESYPEQLIAEIDERWPVGHVDFTTLDEVAKGGPVDWIKIDVEGVELQVLRSGLKTLERHHPTLVIEDHTRVYPWCEQNDIRGQMHELLEGLGYDVESVPYEADTGSPRDFTVAT
jgi:FkbM family methyltransferase